MKRIIRKHPRRTIVIGFLIIIFLGGILLSTPIANENGQGRAFIDSLFTSTSAVCVTGLVVVDIGDSFTTFGETIIAILIQIGGLGITSIGVITILIASGKVSMGGQKLTREAFNLTGGVGLRSVLKGIVYVTMGFELIGAICSYITFRNYYDFPKSVGVSTFHSIAAFNNAGMDIFGGFKNMMLFKDETWLLLVTSGLIIFGGIGFFVTIEIFKKRSWASLSLHSKIVLSTTAVLLVAGTILIKISENTSWITAFFHSVSARTAGFASVSLGGFSTAGLLIVILLMFIGASPGSTGGGIKTTTLFVLFRNMRAVALNNYCNAFKRRIPDSVIAKAMVVVILAATCVGISTLLISLFQPEFPLSKILFEVVSGYATVGLSTGITPELELPSKIILICTMFIGRIGPLTLITLWWKNTKPQARYSEENINIG